MGKSLKRRGQGALEATTINVSSSHAGRIPLCSHGAKKKQKQMSIGSFLNKQQEQDKHNVGPSEPFPFPGKKGGPLEDNSELVYCISQCQTYERTQPELHDAYNDDDPGPEPTLPRGKHCNSSQPTQPYRRQQMGPFGLGISPAKMLPPDEQQAPEQPRTVPTAVVGEPAGASLEGQGSNAPGEPSAAAVGGIPDDATELMAAPQMAEQQQVLPTTSLGPAVTPPLHGPDHGAAVADTVDDGSTEAAEAVPLYPLFMPCNLRRTRQTVILVRHGESEWNAAYSRRKGWSDPSDIFDARLTQLGRKQAQTLRSKVLEHMQRRGDPLFVVSPLSRAIETFLHMLPEPDRLRSGLQLDDGDAVAVSDGGGLQPLSVLISPLAAEFVHTTGDVGRPKTLLMQEYPQVAEHLDSGLSKERWWYEDPKRPNCALQKIMRSAEPKAAGAARVNRFRQMLRAQPQQFIVVVGHGSFFRTLLGESGFLANCEMREVGL